MKKALGFLIFSCLAAAASPAALAFDKPLAKKTSGQSYPHILKTETFSLNTQNVKALTAQGKYLWMGTPLGAVYYDTTTTERFTVFDNQNQLLSDGIFTIKIDDEEFPWIGTYGGGLSHYNGFHWVNINTPHGLCDAFVYDLEFAADAMWIATWSGANRVTGDPFTRESWEAFTVENTQGGLIDDWVYAIELGEDANVWFGTESGVSLYDGKTWRSWNHKKGLGAPYETVKKDNQGVMSQFEGAHHTQHLPGLPNISQPDFRPNYVVSMLLDKKRRLWIGTWGGGLAMLDTRNFKIRNYTVRDGLPGNFILALKQGPLGDLWIGSNGGLSRFDGKTFVNHSKINGLVSNFTFSIEFGQQRALWVGGHNGLARLGFSPETGILVRSE